MRIESIVATEGLHILFTEEFMTKYTNDANIYIFFNRAQVAIPTANSSFTSQDYAQLNRYIKKTTRFANWDEMFKCARSMFKDYRP